MTQLENAACSDVLTQLNTEMENKKSDLVQNSMTSQLWLNYQCMVEVARMLIKADRTVLVHAFAGSFRLPACLCYSWAFPLLGICPLLFAGWNEQSGWKTLRRLSEVVWCFNFGRRSNQCSARLSSDLVIEQTLMKSPKSTGGLTCGRGMTRDMWNLWTLSAPSYQRTTVQCRISRI